MECYGTWSQNRSKGSVDNIRKYRQFAEEHPELMLVVKGKNWYPTANSWVDMMVERTGIDARIITAVVSALSPNNKWNNNLRNAMEMTENYVAGGNMDDVSVQTYRPNKIKAWSFLQGHTWKNGPKTTAFVECITRPGVLNINRRVVVDIWAIRAEIDMLNFGMKCEKCSAEKIAKIVADGGTPKAKDNVQHTASITAKDYARIENEYRMVADEYNETPDETQAIVWVTAQYISDCGFNSIDEYYAAQ